ncbi:MAG: formate dehydrogenase accessory sulfurtransferase FdhD [Gammaproteobacteria bacterium]
MPGLSSFAAERWDGARYREIEDSIADEVPVALRYNCMAYAVMLATPDDIQDFALGFTLSEGIVQSPAEVHAIAHRQLTQGIEVSIRMDAARLTLLQSRRRNLTGRTGCGLCGAETLAQALRPLPAVASELRISPRAVQSAIASLPDTQRLHAATGAVHAAAWADIQGDIVLAREDVGRHNALDKLIGAMASRRLAFDQGFAVLTSRASSEMVQKAATVGIPLLAAVSAPTALAVRLAADCGLTLIGFARDRAHTVYAHGERLRAPGIAVAEAVS